MKLDPNSFDAIIFDLGGVLLNIDYQASKKQFEILGIRDFDLHFSQMKQSHLFDNFEKGLISPSSFRKEIKKEGEISSSDEEIDLAWNAMLLDFPLHRLLFLEKIAKHVPCFLFSNTNAIHIQEFKNRMNAQKLISRFENAFQTIYYSFELGQRKPDSEGFLHILKENNLIAEKTLFIDDSEQHIEGAKKTGLQSILLNNATEVNELFKYE